MNSKGQILVTLDVLEKHLLRQQIEANKHQLFVDAWLKKHILVLMVGAASIGLVLGMNKATKHLATRLISYTQIVQKVF